MDDVIEWDILIPAQLFSSCSGAYTVDTLHMYLYLYLFSYCFCNCIWSLVLGGQCQLLFCQVSLCIDNILSSVFSLMHHLDVKLCVCVFYSASNLNYACKTFVFHLIYLFELFFKGSRPWLEGCSWAAWVCTGWSGRQAGQGARGAQARQAAGHRARPHHAWAGLCCSRAGGEVVALEGLEGG